MKNQPLILKVAIIFVVSVVVFTSIGYYSYKKANPDNFTIKVSDTMLIETKDYQYSRDHNIAKEIAKAENKDVELGILVPSIVDTENLTYPKSVREKVLNSSELSDKIESKNFTIIVIPYNTKIDMDVFIKASKVKNIYFIEEVNTTATSTLDGYYIAKTEDVLSTLLGNYNINKEESPQIIKVENKKVVNSYIKTTKQNIEKIIK